MILISTWLIIVQACANIATFLLKFSFAHKSPPLWSFNLWASTVEITNFNSYRHRLKVLSLLLSRYGHMSRFIDTQKSYFTSYKQLPLVQDANMICNELSFECLRFGTSVINSEVSKHLVSDKSYTLKSGQRCESVEKKGWKKVIQLLCGRELNAFGNDLTMITCRRTNHVLFPSSDWPENFSPFVLLESVNFKPCQCFN